MLQVKKKKTNKQKEPSGEGCWESPFLCKWSLSLFLKELSEAENQFKRMIEHYPNEGLDCLAYCGIGKVYLKKNRSVETPSSRLTPAKPAEMLIPFTSYFGIFPVAR